MEQLVFLYGTMNSGKTAQLLATAHSYIESGKMPVLFTPVVDTRGGIGYIASRIGIKEKANIVDKDTRFFDFQTGEPNELITRNTDVVIVDEGQFLTPSQVQELGAISEYENISVLVYGLKNDFTGSLFEGSKALVELADKMIEIKSVCHMCTHKATQNARLVDGKMVTSGDVIQVGDNDTYTSLCREHYNALRMPSN